MKQTSPPTVVIIDDDPEIVSRVSELLRPHGYLVHGYLSPEAGLEHLRHNAKNTFAVLLDVMFGDEPRGLHIVSNILALPQAPPVLMLSNYERATFVETALKRGAESYVPKENLESLPERLQSYRQHRLRELKPPFSFLHQHGIVTQSEAMRKVAEQIQRCAPTELSVLIIGETGTGKSLVAQALHALSHRASKPFVTVDIPNVVSAPETFSARLFGTVAGAFTGAQDSRGFFHEADGGTLFLDEVGEIPLEQQSRLLKPIEEKRFRRVGSTKEEQVNLRIISATNRDIATMVDQGCFRRDLYERIGQEIIFLPPLRERPEDIPLLARHFAQTLPKDIWPNTPLQTPIGFAEAALEELQKYSWEGNVRELQNFVRRCLLLAHQEGTDTITQRIVRGAFSQKHETQEPPTNGDRKDGTIKELQEAVKKERMQRALESHRGNMTKAAKELGVSREHLYRLCKQYGIDPTAYRSRVT